MFTLRWMRFELHQPRGPRLQAPAVDHLIMSDLVPMDASNPEERIHPTLTRGLVALCRARPSNPVQWLGEWLVENKPLPSAGEQAAVRGEDFRRIHERMDEATLKTS